MKVYILEHCEDVRLYDFSVHVSLESAQKQLEILAEDSFKQELNDGYYVEKDREQYIKDFLDDYAISEHKLNDI